MLSASSTTKSLVSCLSIVVLRQTPSFLLNMPGIWLEHILPWAKRPCEGIPNFYHTTARELVGLPGELELHLRRCLIHKLLSAFGSVHSPTFILTRTLCSI